MNDNDKICFCGSREVIFFIYESYYCKKCYEKQKKKLLDKELSKTNDCLNPQIDQITDKIYLGNYDGARSIDELNIYGITNILTCGVFLHQFYKEDFVYKQLDIDDSLSEDIIRFFKEAIEYIDNSDKIFIHCQAGVSRSASFVIAYLMWKNKLTYSDAKSYVKNKRKAISPNSNFENQLMLFENILKENNFNI